MAVGFENKYRFSFDGFICLLPTTDRCNEYDYKRIYNNNKLLWLLPYGKGNYVWLNKMLVELNMNNIKYFFYKILFEERGFTLSI